MATQYATQDRNSRMTSLVTGLGGLATARFYSGSRLSPTNWVAGTPLATITYGATAVTDANGASAGGVVSGTLTFGGYTQTSSAFVSGTPTWIALVTSGGRCVATIDIGSGSTSVPFTGTIVNSQNMTGTLTITDSNA